MIHIGLLLFFVGRIGFRAVSRVLGVLAPFLGLKKTPCPQTIINWVDRLAFARLQNNGRLLRSSGSSGFIWIIDISIALGAGKILAVSAINADHHMNGKAPDLDSTLCIAVGVAPSWTGESIANFLLKVIDAVGCPAALLKDGGTDLGKAARLLAEKGFSIPCIDDVSHVVANILKHEYGSHPLFDTFISTCGSISKRFKQTLLACLAPPKVTTKARFMNLHRLVAWADKLLKHSPAGRAGKSSLLSKLRKGMGRLPECKSFIRRFLRDADSLLKCQKIIKNKGLTYQTAKECASVIETIPATSPVRIKFMKWTEKQLAIAEKLKLAEIGLPISSDSIESLFGVAKTRLTGEVKDAYRIGIRLPTICGQITPEDARSVLDMSVKQQKQFMDNIPSLIRQRRKVLPNPGSLEMLSSDTATRRLELIQGPKTDQKILKTV